MPENYLDARFSGDIDVISPDLVELNQIIREIDGSLGCRDRRVLHLAA